MPRLHQTTSAVQRGKLNVVSWIDAMFSITHLQQTWFFRVPRVQNTFAYLKAYSNDIFTVVHSVASVFLHHTMSFNWGKTLPFIYPLLLKQNDKCLCNSLSSENIHIIRFIRVTCLRVGVYPLIALHHNSMITSWALRWDFPLEPLKVKKKIK